MSWGAKPDTESRDSVGHGMSTARKQTHAANCDSPPAPTAEARRALETETEQRRRWMASLRCDDMAASSVSAGPEARTPAPAPAPTPPAVAAVAAPACPPPPCLYVQFRAPPDAAASGSFVSSSVPSLFPPQSSTALLHTLSASAPLGFCPRLGLSQRAGASMSYGAFHPQPGS